MLQLLKYIQTTVFLLTSFSITYAQFSLAPTGARAVGIGNITAVGTDVWSTVNNPGALGMLTGVNVGMLHEQRFAMQEMGVSSITGAFPAWGNTIGLFLSNLGFTTYGESRFGAAVGRKLGSSISVGVSISGHVLRFPEGYKNLFAITGDVGIFARPLKNTTLGFHVFNLTFSTWDNQEKTHLPVVFSLGLGHVITPSVQLFAELSKDVYEPIRIKCGTEFLLLNTLHLRTGIIAQPFEVHFGIGYHYKKFQFDIALSRHPVLDYTPVAAINIAL